MKNEMDCKWHFSKMDINAGDEGPNSAMSQTFAQFPCASLVRESIQNSLDAALDTNKPVEVCFEYRILEKQDYCNFFKLSEHIQACKDYYSRNKSANAIYPVMLDYLNNTEEVGFIRVSDFNTKGMDYDEGSTDKTFYAFVRAAGVSVKQVEGAGGSFGFGKGAFFVMSPLNTLIVSTRNKEGICHFEGVTRLCSHVIDGIKYSHMGFYDNNEGQPTSDINKIPIPFRRTESGTSIGIMGIEKRKWKDSIEDLVKEVLSNFFVAILKNKLIVYVDGNAKDHNNSIVICRETIKDLMREYFPDTKDVKRRNSFNPRPYFESMTDSDIPPFTADLPTIGHVELYVKEFDKNVTQIIYLRKLLMKVFRASQSLGNYNGVFICENEIGNKILGDMEDPEHKSWDREQCKKTEIETDYETASKADDEIRQFIGDCIDKLLNINTSESVQIIGLEKYLPSMENEKGKGERGNPFTGLPTGNYVKDGSSITTEGVLKPEPKKVRGLKGNVAEIEINDFNEQKDGDVTGGMGGNGRGHGGGSKVPGDHYTKGIVEDGNGSFKRIVEVDWRPVQSLKKGYTDIVIYSPKDIASAELQFQIGRENLSKKIDKEDVFISSSNKGLADGLKITDVPLKANAKNIVQISFSDNMYHTLILAVYEAD